MYWLVPAWLQAKLRRLSPLSMLIESGNGGVDFECHVGSKLIASGKKTIRFHFDEFELLHHEPKALVRSEVFSCHGHDWSLVLCPGGYKKKGYTTVFLKLEDDLQGSSLILDVTMRAGETTLSVSRKESTTKISGTGWIIAHRSEVLDESKRHLVGGTLTVELDIQTYQAQPEIWSPPSSLQKDVSALFDSEKLSDVTFLVGGQTFHAHRLVLQLRAPILAGMAEDISDDVPIELDRVTPDVFRIILHHIYSDEFTGETLKQHARELVSAADYFGCSRVKVLAENELASSAINVETMPDLLLFAHSNSCPQLKESAIHFFTEHASEVKVTEGYKRLEESTELLKELVKALCERREKSDSVESVSHIRKRLHEAGQDVDGTREDLVKRLKLLEEGS